jgi:hypothetical protein
MRLFRALFGNKDEKKTAHKETPCELFERLQKETIKEESVMTASARLNDLMQKHKRPIPHH